MMKNNKPSREEMCDILANSNGYLKRILAVKGASPDVQEEIAQEAIFQAYERLHKLREPEKLASWLTTIAIRLYIKEYERNKRFVCGSDGNDGTEIIEKLDSGYTDILDEIIKNEEGEYLARTVLKLNSRDSSIIILRYKDGLSLKDIAQTLDMNYSTVRSMHARALAKLKGIVEGEKGDRGNG